MSESPPILKIIDLHIFHLEHFCMEHKFASRRHHSNYRIKRSNSLSELIMFRLPMACEIYCPWGDVHVHNPVNDLRLEVALVLVDHVLLTSVEQLRGGIGSEMVF